MERGTLGPKPSGTGPFFQSLLATATHSSMELTKTDLEILPCQPEMEFSTFLLSLKCACSLISVAGKEKVIHVNLFHHSVATDTVPASREPASCLLSS